jgi:hypothetical protein
MTPEGRDDRDRVREGVYASGWFCRPEGLDAKAKTDLSIDQLAAAVRACLPVTEDDPGGYKDGAAGDESRAELESLRQDLRLQLVYVRDARAERDGLIADKAALMECMTEGGKRDLDRINGLLRDIDRLKAQAIEDNEDRAEQIRVHLLEARSWETARAELVEERDASRRHPLALLLVAKARGYPS